MKKKIAVLSNTGALLSRHAADVSDLCEFEFYAVPAAAEDAERFFRSARPDMVQCEDFAAGRLARHLKETLEIPYLLALDGSGPEGPEDAAAVREAEAVIVTCEALARKLRACVPPARIVALPLGYETRGHTAAKNAERTGSGEILFFSGCGCEPSAARAAIRAFAALARGHFVHARLMLQPCTHEAADGARDRGLQSLACEEGVNEKIVVVTGRQKFPGDAALFLTACAAWERPVLEAMGCGVPVLRLGAADGSGLEVCPAEPAALADRLRAFVCEAEPGRALEAAAERGFNAAGFRSILRGLYEPPQKKETVLFLPWEDSGGLAWTPALP